MALLDELKAAEKANQFARECQACEALRLAPEDARQALESALAGTIGESTLSAILTRNGFPTGRRAINRHRKEGHS